ncbi:MAG TPA: hypothetical protein GXZ93_03330 [Actinobacteria bacterium]|nr:hypothetical protein [Actinomycetota bacterium]
MSGKHALNHLNEQTGKQLGFIIVDTFIKVSLECIQDSFLIALFYRIEKQDGSQTVCSYSSDQHNKDDSKCQK